MNRRTVLQSLAALPAVTLPAVGQGPATAVAAAAESPLPKTALTNAEAVAATVPKFFTSEQAAAMKRLAELIVPAGGGNPGAVEAEAPQFLDFLLSQSPASRQMLYRQGLDKLNRDAHSRFGNSFAQVSAAQADTLLAPLKQPYPYEEPSDLFFRFLGTAKQDLLVATTNSRQWAASPTRGRSGSNLGMYWFPIE